MSLVPYTPLLGNLDNQDAAFLASSAVAMMVLAFGIANQLEDDIVQAEVTGINTEEENIPTIKAPTLDDELLRILGTSPKPLTARDIVKQLPHFTKSEVNSRLYTLLGRKALIKKDTGSAPLWSKNM